MEERNSAREVATGGIAVLLTVVFIYLAYVLPTGRIFLFSLSTAFISVMVIEYGVKAAFMTFAASALLGLVIIPGKLIILPYIIFFGYYGIIKSYFEKKNNLIVEWLLKYFSFNIALIIFYYIYMLVLGLPLESEVSFYILLIIAEVFLFIYDYCYSLAISYYMRFLREIIHR